MNQLFFTNTIQSNFIKSIVYNTPLPNIPTANENSYLIKDNYYIIKSHIVLCTKSGVVKKLDTNDNAHLMFKNGTIKRVPFEDSSDNYLRYIKDGYVDIEQADYKIVNNFHFGYFYPKLTSIFSSKFSYYDTDTHIALGNYLRCYRDMYDIDLMPFYNCVCGDYMSGVVIGSNELEFTDSSYYKTFKIPVKFNTSYTIALDCNSRVRVSPILLSSGTPINPISYVGTNDSLDFNSDIVNGNIYEFNSMSFKNLQVVGVNTLNYDSNEILQKYEKYLYLLIQVPVTNNSSIVVLEGDYTNLNSTKIFNKEKIQYISNVELNSLLLSDLSLLQFSDGIIYPYSNRLIEYLLNNVITNREEIDKNIERVQKTVNEPSPYEVRGVWNKSLRISIANKYQHLDYLKQLDLNGFVDKDTEYIMSKY